MAGSLSVCPHQFPLFDGDDFGPVSGQDCQQTGNRAMRESRKLTNEDVSRTLRPAADIGRPPEIGPLAGRIEPVIAYHVPAKWVPLGGGAI